MLSGTRSKLYDLEGKYDTAIQTCFFCNEASISNHIERTNIKTNLSSMHNWILAGAFRI